MNDIWSKHGDFVLAGLVLTDKSEIMTLDHGRGCFVFFTQKGLKLREETFQPLKGRPYEAKCRFMAVHKDMVVVTDLGM